MLETATHQAEREMERIIGLDYSSIALTTAPASSTDEKDPRYFVTPGTPPSYQWDQGATGPQTGDLVIDAAGALSPSAITWQDGQSRLSGEIHRFVTWTSDLCTTTGCGASTTQRAKRITIAVTVDGAFKMRQPLVISSIKIDPISTG